MNLHDWGELARTGTSVVIFLTALLQACAKLERHLKERINRRTP